MREPIIWIIDDDGDDHELIREIFQELKLPYHLQFFVGAETVLSRLKNSGPSPFIIICDVNLPVMNGFELREHLLENDATEAGTVPFIFWSTYASPAQIKHAYELKAHGFFIKEQSYAEWKLTLLDIVKYWKKSRVPEDEN